MPFLIDKHSDTWILSFKLKVAGKSWVFVSVIFWFSLDNYLLSRNLKVTAVLLDSIVGINVAGLLKDQNETWMIVLGNDLVNLLKLYVTLC